MVIFTPVLVLAVVMIFVYTMSMENEIENQNPFSKLKLKIEIENRNQNPFLVSDDTDGYYNPFDDISGADDGHSVVSVVQPISLEAIASAPVAKDPSSNLPTQIDNNSMHSTIYANADVWQSWLTNRGDLMKQLRENSISAKDVMREMLYSDMKVPNMPSISTLEAMLMTVQRKAVAEGDMNAVKFLWQEVVHNGVQKQEVTVRHIPDAVREALDAAGVKIIDITPDEPDS